MRREKKEKEMKKKKERKKKGAEEKTIKIEKNPPRSVSREARYSYLR